MSLPPSGWSLQRARLGLPPQTGRAVAGQGPRGSHLLRKVCLRTEEPMRRLCCRSSFCSSSCRCSSLWTSMVWGGRGSPAPPKLCGRVMATRATTCQGQGPWSFHHMPACPLPCSLPNISMRLAGWGGWGCPLYSGQTGKLRSERERDLPKVAEAGFRL